MQADRVLCNRQASRLAVWLDRVGAGTIEEQALCDASKIRTLDPVLRQVHLANTLVALPQFLINGSELVKTGDHYDFRTKPNGNN